MQCNIGRNSAGQGATMPFVGRASCPVGSLDDYSGASRSIGGLGIACDGVG